MAITFMQVNKVGDVGMPGRAIYIECDDMYDTVTTQGYMDKAAAAYPINMVGTDTVYSLMKTGSGDDKKRVKLGVRIVDGSIKLSSSLYDEEVIPSKIVNTVMNYTTRSITAAEFNGMYAAPKLLVSAPGASNLIMVDKVALVQTYGTGAFAAGGVAAAQYDSTINGAGVIATSTLSAATFQVTADTTYTMNGGVVPAPSATCVNKGLYLSNITGAFTTGDSDMVAHIWYKIIPV